MGVRPSVPRPDQSSLCSPCASSVRCPCPVPRYVPSLPSLDPPPRPPASLGPGPCHLPATAARPGRHSQNSTSRYLWAASASSKLPLCSTRTWSSSSGSAPARPSAARARQRRTRRSMSAAGAALQLAPRDSEATRARPARPALINPAAARAPACARVRLASYAGARLRRALIGCPRRSPPWIPKSYGGLLCLGPGLAERLALALFPSLSLALGAELSLPRLVTGGFLPHFPRVWNGRHLRRPGLCGSRLAKQCAHPARSFVERGSGAESAGEGRGRACASETPRVAF